MVLKCSLWIKMASCYSGREECWEFFIFLTSWGWGRGFQEEWRGEKALERFRGRLIHGNPTLDQHISTVYKIILSCRQEGGGGGMGGGGAWSRTPAPFSRTSRIPNFSPNTVFFPASRAKLLANPAFRVAVNQVKTKCVSRIPHCISIKSRAHRTTSKT